jgi:hypothetical protein
VPALKAKVDSSLTASGLWPRGMVGPWPHRPFTFRALCKTYGQMWLRCDVCRRYARLSLAGLHDVDYRTKTFSCSVCGTWSGAAVLLLEGEAGVAALQVDAVLHLGVRVDVEALAERHDLGRLAAAAAVQSEKARDLRRQVGDQLAVAVGAVIGADQVEDVEGQTSKREKNRPGN